MEQLYKKRWIGYLVFGLSVFLLFCLCFESYIKPPVLVSWLGRWHPLILHFPIVLLVVAVFTSFTQKKVAALLLITATLTALITAISGFLLGLDESQKGDLLFWHQWLGAGVALFAALWYWLETLNYGQHIGTKTLQIILIFLVAITGHYGGSITHGENFLDMPKDKSYAKIPDNPLIYEHIVDRILEQNCVSCHNPNKQKGELVVTSLKDLIKGGENGSSIHAGNPDKSVLLNRLYLPKEDKEHMPPEGKKQLSTTEIEIIKEWISLGASDTLRLNDLKTNQPLAKLVTKMMSPNQLEKWSVLPIVQDSTIQRLESDYVTIRRVFGNTNALSINMYTPPTYNPDLILRLNAIRNNIIELDLSGLPIEAKEIEFVASCTNLESLEIDKTAITDHDIKALNTLTKLKSLKVSETEIGDKSTAVLSNFKNLKNLFIYETNISQNGIDQLQGNNPELRIISGISEELRAAFIQTDSIKKEQ